MNLIYEAMTARIGWAIGELALVLGGVVIICAGILAFAIVAGFRDYVRSKTKRSE